MIEGRMEMADYTEVPLRDEADKEKVLENLEVKANKIFDFLNENRQLIEGVISESQDLRATGLQADLDYILENIKELIPLLEKHKTDISIIYNHLEDRLGSFSAGVNGHLKRLIEKKLVTPQVENILEKDSSAFARYLKTSLEDENYLLNEVQSYRGQGLH